MGGGKIETGFQNDITKFSLNKSAPGQGGKGGREGREGSVTCDATGIRHGGCEMDDTSTGSSK